MIGDTNPVTTLGVKDIARAREFYEGTLGFPPGTEMMDQGVTYQSGSGAFFIYTSEFAGTNQATSMMFELPGDAFDETVADLRAKGVSFETYDMPDTEWNDGVASMSSGDSSFRSVWFRDPDGNILNLGTGMS